MVCCINVCIAISYCVTIVIIIYGLAQGSRGNATKILSPLSHFFFFSLILIVPPAQSVYYRNTATRIIVLSFRVDRMCSIYVVEGSESPNGRVSAVGRFWWVVFALFRVDFFETLHKSSAPAFYEWDHWILPFNRDTVITRILFRSTFVFVLYVCWRIERAYTVTAGRAHAVRVFIVFPRFTVGTFSTSWRSC